DNPTNIAWQESANDQYGLPPADGRQESWCSTSIAFLICRPNRRDALLFQRLKAGDDQRSCSEWQPFRPVHRQRSTAPSEARRNILCPGEQSNDALRRIRVPLTRL